MSSEIRGLNQAQQSSIQNLKRQHAREVAFVEKNHDKRIDELKKSQESEISQLRDDGQIQLANEIEKKEKTLKALNTSLEQTRNITEKEEKRLLSHSTLRKNDIREQNAKQIDQIVQQSEEQIKDVSDRFNSKINELNENSKERLNQTNYSNRVVYNQEKDTWSDKIQNQRKNFQSAFKAEGDKYEHLTEKQKTVARKNLENLEKREQSKLASANQKFVNLNEVTINQHQKTAADRDQLFEKKYQTQLAQHQSYEDNLNKLHSNTIEKAKASLHKTLTLEKERSNDDFFNFTELKPTIKELPDGYELRIKVPDYAKEEVTLTTNHKELVLSANRRFKDERTDESGVLKKVSKVESLVSRIPVDQVLSPRKMTKNWVDGELVFKVNKA